MLLIVGTFRLPAHNLEQARPIMRRMAEASRAEAGCAEYVYAEDLFEPGLIHVRELWADQAALDHHSRPPISSNGAPPGRASASASEASVSLTSECLGRREVAR